MTIGERIQQYRKAEKLSQEELAGKLFVSRQTVSLWEKDQTLPTIDNLIRLKEIFNISLDELLTGTDEAERLNPVTEKNVPSEVSDSALPASEGTGEPSPSDDPDAPAEAYRAQYSLDEIKAHFKTMRKKRNKQLILKYLIIILVYIAVVCFNFPDLIVGISAGILFIFIVLDIFIGFVNHKTNRQGMKLIPEKTYAYEIWSDRMTVTVRKENELVSKWVIPYREITSCVETDLFYAFTYAGNTFLIRKSDLQVNSHLRLALSVATEHKWVKKPREYKIAMALFVASLCCIWVPMLCVAIPTEFGADMTGVMWVFYLFLPIPIASIFVGYLFRKRGIKTLKNIVCGVIVTAFLILYGSFSFMFDGMEFDLADVEARTNLDLPEPDKITNVSYSAHVGADGNELFYTYHIYFDEADAEVFEAQLAEDDRWLPGLPQDLLSFIWREADLAAADYFVFCDINGRIYNAPPAADGDISFIYILYDADENRAEITEYTLTGSEE